MRRLLLHERLIVRFVSLLVLGGLLFTAAWYVAYAWLPEGFLRGRTAIPAEVLEETSTTVFREWLRIVSYNATVPVVLIILANFFTLFKVYPLGYVPPLFNSILYGLVLGTNSFAIPMPQRMAPSPAILERAGPYEFAGMFMVAAATYSLSRVRVERRPAGGLLVRVAPVWEALRREQWIGLAVGIGLILLAGWREAMMIVARGGG